MPSEPRELHVRLHGFIHGRQARQWRKILARLESLFDGHRVYTRTRTRAQTRAADVMPRSATFRLSRGTEPARFSRGTELSNGKDEKGKGREGGKKGRRGRRKEEERGGGGGGGGGRAKEVQGKGDKILYSGGEKRVLFVIFETWNCAWRFGSRWRLLRTWCWQQVVDRCKIKLVSYGILKNWEIVSQVREY